MSLGQEMTDFVAAHRELGPYLHCIVGACVTCPDATYSNHLAPTVQEMYEHMQTCTLCHSRFVYHKKVQDSFDRESEKQQKLKRGDGMPHCHDCKVVRPAWSRQYSRTKVLRAMSVIRKQVVSKDIDDVTTFESIGFTEEMRLALWYKFVAGSDEEEPVPHENGGATWLMPESKLPKTIYEMADDVYRLHQRPVFQACDAHWP